ncbi:MAG: hypothetical protein IH968_19300 [Gemmatimonadetes bacterium]|nr:hypothetical protein [Gemmatimonadota bacterium]
MAVVTLADLVVSSPLQVFGHRLSEHSRPSFAPDLLRCVEIGEEAWLHHNLYRFHVGKIRGIYIHSQRSPPREAARALKHTPDLTATAMGTWDDSTDPNVEVFFGKWAA